MENTADGKALKILGYFSYSSASKSSPIKGHCNALVCGQETKGANGGVRDGD